MRYLARYFSCLALFGSLAVIFPGSVASASCVESAPGPYRIVVDVRVEEVSADHTAAIVRTVHVQKGSLDLKRFAVWVVDPTAPLVRGEVSASPAIPPSAALQISDSGKLYRLYARSSQRNLPKVYGVPARLKIPLCSPSRPI
jgi:hypothetical protein